MILSIEEIKKLFSFMSENKKSVLSYRKLFDRTTFTNLKEILKEKHPNDFILSEEQANALKTIFINGTNGFDNLTPNFITQSQDCIFAALEKDINSINYVKELPQEISKEILKIVVSKGYVLTNDSPTFLRKSYEVALNSIRNDASSADYIFWHLISDERRDELVKETINCGYELSENSEIYLLKNVDVSFNSITKNKNTIKFLDSEIKDNPKIFKYLVSINYNFTWDDLKRKRLPLFLEDDLIKYAITKSKMFSSPSYSNIFYDSYSNYTFNEHSNKYIERFIEFYSKVITTFPKIENFMQVFQYANEEGWKEFKEDNVNDYANIFAKICIELKHSKEYDKAINNLQFLQNMKEQLGEKYNLLIQAMKQYHKIVHGSESLEEIDSCRDEIAKLSALYVAISKENYKKELLRNEFEDVKYFFIPRINNPLVHKKTLEHKQKEKFIKLCRNNDNEIQNFLRNIVNQYKDNINQGLLWRMVNGFILNNQHKFEDYMKEPDGFADYIRYCEAKKLINRLNSKYIKYTDPEVTKYLDIINCYVSGKYYYCGPNFDDSLISNYNSFKNKKQIFEKIKQQIMFKVKKIEIDEEISKSELKAIKDDLPFTDEYFEFDKSVLESCTLYSFFHCCIPYNHNFIEPSSILNDEAYDFLTKFTIDNGLIWLILLSYEYDFCSAEIDFESVFDLFDYMKDIIDYSKELDYDITKYENVLTLSQLVECADQRQIAILGKDIISKLCKYRDYTNDEAKYIVEAASNLVCQMAMREKSTVPYINGKTTNYLYSMYDTQDEEILLAGINTNACFRIDGNDNDFLHYCALDKNGFVIKITDIYGNFVARAAGFRNGNAVYINQLRTIYDTGGWGYEGNYNNERLDIIRTFKKACFDIVETSQQNENEENKIDFVFVTKSYAMSKIKCNVSNDVVDKIGDNPMDRKSHDWEDFVNSTEYLQEVSDKEDTFSTDYGNYSVICVASSEKYKNTESIQPKDIKPKDVKAVYKRKRNEVELFINGDVNVVNKINRINGIFSYVNGYECVNILSTLGKDSAIFLGDNWYIIYENDEIIYSCVLDFDEKAIVECSKIKDALEKMEKSDNPLKRLKLYH